MSSSEEVAYPILRKHDVDYVLVIFGGLLGYSGDDINKFLWMVRIAQGVWPDEIQEPNYFTPKGEYRVDEAAAPAMKNSLMYKMSYYRCVVGWRLWRVLCMLTPFRRPYPHLLPSRTIVPSWQVRGAVRRQPSGRPRAWSAGPQERPNARLPR